MGAGIKETEDWFKNISPATPNSISVPYFAVATSGLLTTRQIIPTTTFQSRRPAQPCSDERMAMPEFAALAEIVEQHAGPRLVDEHVQLKQVHSSLLGIETARLWLQIPIHQ